MRTTVDVGKVVIRKLDGTNYLIWATQVDALLQARGLCYHVSTEVVLPERDESGYAESMKARCMARAAIICSIESEYVPMVAGVDDPKVIWDKLDDADKSKCTASSHTLRNRLMNVKMTQGMTIRSYVNEICTIKRQLAFAGKIVAEEDKKYALLKGLGSAYQVKKVILQENYGTSFEQMVSSLELTEDETALSGRGSSSNASCVVTVMKPVSMNYPEWNQCQKDDRMLSSSMREKMMQ